MTLSALLMALLRRKDTGQGDYIDVAMADSLIAAMLNNFGSTFAENRAPVLTAERALGGYAFYNIYETKDGRHVVFGGSETHFAKAALDKLGRPDLLESATTPPGPGQDPAKAFLREVIKTRTQAEWTAFAQQHGDLERVVRARVIAPRQDVIQAQHAQNTRCQA